MLSRLGAFYGKIGENYLQIKIRSKIIQRIILEGKQVSHAKKLIFHVKEIIKDPLSLLSQIIVEKGPLSEKISYKIMEMEFLSKKNWGTSLLLKEGNGAKK